MTRSIRTFGSLVLFISTAALGQAPDVTPKLLRVDGSKVEGEYIVVFHDGAAATSIAGEMTRNQTGRVARVWRRALNGALLTGIDERRAEAIARDPRVRWIEENGVMTIDASQTNPPSWGLDRIDQRALPLDDTYRSELAGRGVTAYVIDTGIRVSHQDFGGRASWGFNAHDANDTDCNGHGTHVAATLGGSLHGVAKDVELVAVKVLGCGGSGSFAAVISGIDWVSENAVHPAVANLSLGGPASLSVDLAVDRSAAAGIFYAVAAGNDDGPACFKSPARAPGAYTVGASTIDDERAGFSNWGDCVEVFAPGTAITMPPSIRSRRFAS